MVNIIFLLLFSEIHPEGVVRADTSVIATKMDWISWIDMEIDTSSDIVFTVPAEDTAKIKAFRIYLSGYIDCSGTNHCIVVRPNGDAVSTNYAMGTQKSWYYDAGSHSEVQGWWGTYVGLALMRNGWNADGYITSESLLQTDISVYPMVRTIRSKGTYFMSTAADNYEQFYMGNVWLNTTDYITSLTLHFDGALDFDGRVRIDYIK
jgi:hypothetical protein